jgi:arylsulfatase A-like enzyme
VVSDHGFSHSVFGVNLTAELIKAGLKASTDSDDVVIASSGQSMLLHVKDRDPARIQQLTEFLMARDWIGVLFTMARPGDDRPMVEGTVPGTFALELIHLANAERGPDIVVTFPWSSAPGPHGVPGTDYTETARETGALSGAQGNHGSMSPWTVRNTFIAWGVDFKRGATVRTPVSNVDLTPTLLALMGLDGDTALPRFDGRAIGEAFVDGPDPEKMPVSTITHRTASRDRSYQAEIQVSNTTGGNTYIDKSWRIR